MTPALRHTVRRSLPVTALVAVLLALFAVSDASAQPAGARYLGRHFIVAIPDTLTNGAGGTVYPFASIAEIVIFSFDGTATVTVGANGSSRTLSVGPDASEIVSFHEFYTLVSPFVDVRGTPVQRALEVRADRPIGVYCRYATQFGAEEFAPLPVESWGTDYSLITLRNGPVFNIRGLEESQQTVTDAPPQLMVIASEDATRIGIYAPGLPAPIQQVVLDAGEAYLTTTLPPRNAEDTVARDLSGLSIRSDKPIAVLSGNTRSGGSRGTAGLASLTGNTTRNSLVEWLPPTSLLGNAFVYSPMQPENEKEIEELIRVVAVEEGTTVSVSYDGSHVLDAGEWIEISGKRTRLNDAPAALVINADKPVYAAAISGSHAEYENHPWGPDFQAQRTWAPGMTLLTPAAGWVDVGRFNAPVGPQTRHFAVIVAEENAQVFIDDTEAPLDPVGTAGFRHGRVEVGPGDHLIRSTGGTFSAITFGYMRGYEAFKPLGIERDDKDPSPSMMHISEYEEILAATYAAPVIGIRSDDFNRIDSVAIERTDRCDSTTIDVRRFSDQPWLLAPMTAELSPGSVNVAMTVDTVARLFGVVLAYRVRLAPADPSLDASGSVVVTASGFERTIAFEYEADWFGIAGSLDLGADLQMGTPYVATATATNRRRFAVTFLYARLRHGDRGFSVGRADPKALRSDESVDLSVGFNGVEPGLTSRDTLIVGTDCGEFLIPLVAATAGLPPPPPIPTITGFDWGIRSVGGTYDALSFIGNDGGRSYVIGDVHIIEDAAGAFDLVPPDHGFAIVPPGIVRQTGIRFAPPGPGEFRARIVLIAADNDGTDTADLHGIARGFVRITTGNVQITDRSCPADTLDTSFVVRNDGNIDARINEPIVLSALNATVLPVATAPPFPSTLRPGGSLRIPIRIVPRASGPYLARFAIDTGVGGAATFVDVAGIADTCTGDTTTNDTTVVDTTVVGQRELTVTDHDFGSIWITLTTQGSVELRNIGKGDVLVTSARLDDPTGSFTVIGPHPPFVVVEGDTVVVQCSFTPTTEGRKDARIVYETEVGQRTARLVGVGKVLVVPAFIRRDYHGAPGEEVEIAVEIEQPAEPIAPAKMNVDLRFADDLLDPFAVRDTLGAGSPTIDVGLLSAVINRSPEPLNAGPILFGRFLVRFSLLESTELPFTLTSDLPWVEFEERPGLFTRDTICGLSHRLFEFSESDLVIGDPRPSPASDVVIFPFSIPFENPTVVIVYDLLGAERLRPLDAVLVPGAYDLQIPVSGLPNGVYVLRFRSGEYAATRRIVVRR